VNGTPTAMESASVSADSSGAFGSGSASFTAPPGTEPSAYAFTPYESGSAHDVMS